ncbi:phytanoyl-CoA dioxygenase family protein [Nguyenibacter sp. L1]|uniref:phytanoyl-CoA dioxygenase family protein n=1 Tax=Nguyenibacter sp. L1 TaxID=3049350 RepID=UPI002B49224A|nr:phytanoyl-CoA dioxygenase family protein [Nguyenibacter sp. L1]WRH89789.1 phytanoyl-CoA dioxygenase family protein [Nguyenibacter sp. L1]
MTSTPALITLPAGASVNEVVEIIERDGGVVLEKFLDAAAFLELKTEIDAALATSAFGDTDDFVGTDTLRASRLFARCRRMVDVVLHPLYLGAARKILQKPIEVWFGEKRTPIIPLVQIGMTQAIQICPGQGLQPLHRDDTSFLWRHPHYGREARVQIMVAMTDFTAANGATRVIPGSHKWDDERCPQQAESIPAEMTAGSALIFIGSTYHGGGTNNTDRPRIGVTMAIDLGTVRQEENQYLSVPYKTLKELPTEVQKLLGWDAGENFMGWYESGGKMHNPFDYLAAENIPQALGLVESSD